MQRRGESDVAVGRHEPRRSRPNAAARGLHCQRLVEMMAAMAMEGEAVAAVVPAAVVAAKSDRVVVGALAVSAGGYAQCPR